jgi:hypothetical protein
MGATVVSRLRTLPDLLGVFVEVKGSPPDSGRRGSTGQIPLTRKRSLVQIQYGPHDLGEVCAGSTGASRHLSQGTTPWNPRGEPPAWTWEPPVTDSPQTPTGGTASEMAYGF